ncbi:uncharacterized protein ARMOST_06443 [Armillaria ostoyae]|uniref:Uncharacterized protein n=1 Tax=Armillaria ostoyae TaxID=47428 RepID=A0A284R2Y7_ARMOS|nr:uncharacterized protein ARMOST_06443 [Armillaria ostoyae]
MPFLAAQAYVFRNILFVPRDCLGGGIFIYAQLGYALLACLRRRGIRRLGGNCLKLKTSQFHVQYSSSLILSICLQHYEDNGCRKFPWFNVRGSDGMIGPCDARLYGAVIRKSSHIALVLDMERSYVECSCVRLSRFKISFDLPDLKGTMNVPHVTDQALWLLLKVYH